MINLVLLHGNTGDEPKVSYTTTGKMKVVFSLAVNQPFGDKKPDWFRIECWGKLPDVMAKHGFKGQKLLVKGSIRTEKYDKDGETQYYTKIVASEIDIINWSFDEADLVQERSTDNNRPFNWKDVPVEVTQALQKHLATFIT